MSDSDITIKKSTLTKLVVVSVAALRLASFFGGYNLGGGGNTVTITREGSNNTAALPPLEKRSHHRKG